jgi:hypothetical protein
MDYENFDIRPDYNDRPVKRTRNESDDITRSYVNVITPICYEYVIHYPNIFPIEVKCPSTDKGK